MVGEEKEVVVDKRENICKEFMIGVNIEGEAHT